MHPEHNEDHEKRGVKAEQRALLIDRLARYVPKKRKIVVGSFVVPDPDRVRGAR
jgi:hypothetical protein